jgi:hypothetical protein
MAEEARKLAEVAHLWLAARSGAARSPSAAGDRAHDVWAEATAEPSTGVPPECAGCPYCRVRRTLSDVSPEVYHHLSAAAGSLAAALRTLGKDVGRS